MIVEELRIGNVLQSDYDYYTLNSVDRERVCVIDKNEEHTLMHISNFNPIPLTPEILTEWCGFEKDGFGAFNLSINPFKRGIKKLIFAGDYLYIVDDKDHIVLWNKDIMKEFYLHQLQNLFYALAGVELTVNVK